MRIREETADHARIENLKKFWVEDYEKEEERSPAIWNKKKKNLSKVMTKI